MRIQASVGTGINGRSQQSASPREAVAEAVRTNLPAVVPAPARPAMAHRPQVRPLATVIAQLAAGAGDHPFTRARRRAEPSEGASLYALAAAVTPQAQKTIIRIL